MSSTSVPGLIRSLVSADRHERAQASILLGKQGVTSALGELRVLVDDDDPIVALAGMFACWKLGEDRLSMDRLLSAFKSGDEELVQQAVCTVYAIGVPLIPRLTPLLNQSPEDAMLALKLLDEIGGPEALQAIQAVRSADKEVSALVEEILGDWDDEPREDYGEELPEEPS